MKKGLPVNERRERALKAAQRRAEFLRKLDKPVTTDDEADVVAAAFDSEAEIARARQGGQRGRTNRTTDEFVPIFDALVSKHPKARSVEQVRRSKSTDPQAAALSGRTFARRWAEAKERAGLKNK